MIERVAFLGYHPPDNFLTKPIVEVLQEGGVQVDPVVYPKDGLPDLGHYDRALIVGTVDSHHSLVQELSRRKNELPPLRVWHSEQLPNLEAPAKFIKTLASLRQAIDIYPSARTIRRMGRYRMLGEFMHLADIPKIKFHSFSQSNAEKLIDWGIPTSHTPYGYVKDMGETKREFNDRKKGIVFMGTMHKKRKVRVEEIGRQLKQNGIEFSVYDGRPKYIYGEERNTLLNTTMVALVVPAQEGDDHVYRCSMHASNGQLNVVLGNTPSTLNPFEDGKDVISATFETVLQVCQEIFSNPSKGAEIAQNGNRKITSLPLRDQIQKVLA